MYDPQKIYDALILAGNDWADKKAAFQLLDDMTKTILAERVSEMSGSSMSEKQEKARADSMYKAHLNGLGEARKAYLMAEVKYRSIQALSDHRRTEQSTKRAEIKHLGG